MGDEDFDAADEEGEEEEGAEPVSCADEEGVAGRLSWNGWPPEKLTSIRGNVKILLV